MTEPKNPKEMGLGEIVRELNLLFSVRTLSTVIDSEKAYARAPSHCKNPNDLFAREDRLYEELNRREKNYLRTPTHVHLGQRRYR